MIYHIICSANVPIGKAGQDLYILDLILSGVQTCVDKYSLDERLRTEYKTIEEMKKFRTNSVTMMVDKRCVLHLKI